jgi:Tfp pilus assembly protein PilN
MRIINLLPLARQNELRYEEYARFVILTGVFVLLALVAAYGVLLFGLTTVQSRISSLKHEIEEKEERLQAFTQVEIRDRASELNHMLLVFERAEAVRILWSPILQEFASQVPTDVVISRFVVSQTTKQVSVSGLARTREDMLRFRENILSSTKFRDINFPLSNLSKPVDIPFRYTFYLK